MAMRDHTGEIRLQLSREALGARQLLDIIGISQPTLSRALNRMGDEIVRIGAARSIQYALRDQRRGFSGIAIYRVSAAGQVSSLGTLIPVFPDGFVMRQDDGVTLYSAGLPWWLFDMRPQGFLGRAYVAMHAATLGLSTRLTDWDDREILRALLTHGHDAVGNLLLGELARERFVDAPAPQPLIMNGKGEAYAVLAQEALQGDVAGSSAGGEQPKFLTFAETSAGAHHVLVKFTLPDQNPVTERWRDLLLAEHHALATLMDGGVEAARSTIIDHEGQRFLEVERFDRVGALGRRGLFSLAAVEAEFVGNGSAPWPVIATELAVAGHITDAAAEGVALLYAFGCLIGNTDMHNGNLSFTSEQGRPYELAPAYDMLPMGLAPRSGGGLPATLPAASLRSCVSTASWLRALDLATDWLARIRADARFSTAFEVCIAALAAHIDDARMRILRLG
jgi:hypothetical protein